MTVGQIVTCSSTKRLKRHAQSHNNTTIFRKLNTILLSENKNHEPAVNGKDMYIFSVIPH